MWKRGGLVSGAGARRWPARCDSNALVLWRASGGGSVAVAGLRDSPPSQRYASEHQPSHHCDSGSGRRIRVVGQIQAYD